MNKKVYYNLTKIKNGWLVSYLDHEASTHVAGASSMEEFFENLPDVFKFVSKEEEKEKKELKNTVKEMDLRNDDKDAVFNAQGEAFKTMEEKILDAAEKDGIEIGSREEVDEDMFPFSQKTDLPKE